MTDCIFCKIINKEIPAEIFYEDNNVIGFLDIRPVSRGHSLVIPKNHFEDLLSTPDETIMAMMATVKKISTGLMQVTGAAGFNTGINTKQAAGQAVFHTHFHVIPRYVHDDLIMWPHHESQQLTRAQLAEELKKQFN